MIVIPGVLGADEVQQVRARLASADWVDGSATAGHLAVGAKHNSQLPEDAAEAHALGELVLDALGRSPLFVAAALPLKVYPPLFNRYEAGESYGDHVDSAIRIRRGSDFRVRGDLSMTLFLSDPDDYDGGELRAEGHPPVKLPAGDAVLYSAATVHHVAPVTRGVRIASFFWVQSMIRDAAARAILLDLDRSVQDLSQRVEPQDPAIVRLTGVYHNLLRRWADL